MSVSATAVKELRDRTGLGFMDCKKALTETNGNLDEAVVWLRKKGLAKSAKLASRIASEGIVYSYIHGEGRIGVLLELNCETDFTARNQQFQTLAKEIALHIAATNPRFLSREDVTQAVLEQERDIAAEQARASGKPPQVVEKIVEGKLDKFYEENCLLEQKFVKDNSKSVGELIKGLTATIGENISLRRYTRYHVGEGLQKREDNFAVEVAKQAKIS